MLPPLVFPGVPIIIEPQLKISGMKVNSFVTIYQSMAKLHVIITCNYITRCINYKFKSFIRLNTSQSQPMMLQNREKLMSHLNQQPTLKLLIKPLKLLVPKYVVNLVFYLFGQPSFIQIGHANRIGPYLSVLGRSRSVRWPQSLDGG